MKKLRERETGLRGNLVEWPGIEPGTSGLKVHQLSCISLGRYSVLSLRLSRDSAEKLPGFRGALRSSHAS